VLPWLLEGDPAIRWQVLRDLAGEAENRIERERKRVARQGWGAQLLAKQDPQGTWAGGLTADSGLYTPKWISTTYTMLLLRDFGLPAKDRKAKKACKLLLDRGLQPDGGVAYGTWAKWQRRGETCISGMVLSILSHFEYDDDRLDRVAGHLVAEQMPDGGWNCRRSGGATHSSVHTTISVLEGLRLYERHRAPEAKAIREAQRRGREFLLVHRLFRSHRTGEIIKPAFTRFAFPPRWHYDILRAGPFSECRCTLRRAPLRGNRHRPQYPIGGRTLAPEPLTQRKNVFRAGARRCAQPLEHAPCTAGFEVVGSELKNGRAVLADWPNSRMNYRPRLSASATDQSLPPRVQLRDLLLEVLDDPGAAHFHGGR
jgi:hypothetical protein